MASSPIPGVAVLTNGSKYETRSHLAFKTGWPPAPHSSRVSGAVRTSEPGTV